MSGFGFNNVAFVGSLAASSGAAGPVVPPSVYARNLIQRPGGSNWSLTQEGVAATGLLLPDGAIEITPQSQGSNAYRLRYEYTNTVIANNTNYELWLVAKVATGSGTLDIRSEARNEGYHSFTTGLPTVSLTTDYTLQVIPFSTAGLNPAAGNNMLPTLFLGQSYPQVTTIRDIVLVAV